MRVAQDILAVLDAAKLDGNRLYLQGALDRKTYQEANKVIEAAGGRWDRKAKAHVFEQDAADTIEPILLTGEAEITRIVTEQQKFGAFYTPEPLAEKVVRLAGIEAGMTVLEPNAGDGALAGPAAAQGGVVTCVEVRETSVPAIRADFLTLEPDTIGRFDRVVMNPPFAKLADVAHVSHALQFLKPGGRLVAIMSQSFTFRSDGKSAAFRDLVAANNGTVEKLPGGEFKSAGTMVNTCIVTLEKAA